MWVHFKSHCLWNYFTGNSKQINGYIFIIYYIFCLLIYMNPSSLREPRLKSRQWFYLEMIWKGTAAGNSEKSSGSSPLLALYVCVPAFVCMKLNRRSHFVSVTVTYNYTHYVAVTLDHKMKVAIEESQLTGRTVWNISNTNRFLTPGLQPVPSSRLPKHPSLACFITFNIQCPQNRASGRRVVSYRLFPSTLISSKHLTLAA